MQHYTQLYAFGQKADYYNLDEKKIPITANIVLSFSNYFTTEKVKMSISDLGPMTVELNTVLNLIIRNQIYKLAEKCNLSHYNLKRPEAIEVVIYS